MECVNKHIAGRTDKEYYHENRDKIAGKKHDYYEVNKTVIQTKTKQKFTCECGSVCRRGDKAQHNRSDKHQNYLNLQ